MDNPFVQSPIERRRHVQFKAFGALFLLLLNIETNESAVLALKYIQEDFNHLKNNHRGLKGEEILLTVDRQTGQVKVWHLVCLHSKNTAKIHKIFYFYTSDHDVQKCIHLSHVNRMSVDGL